MGHLQIRNHHLLSHNHHLVADCDCCGGDLCLCPDPAPTTLVLTGHVRGVDGVGTVICDNDFTNILTVTDAVNCRWDNGPDQEIIVCVPLSVDIDLILIPGVSWQLGLAFAGGGFESTGYTTRPCADGFLGAYPNVGSSPGLTFTSLVIS